MFVNLILLDALVGPSCTDRAVRKNKLKNLQAGLYDDLFVNIEVPNNIEDSKFDDLESYLRHLTDFASRRRLTETVRSGSLRRPRRPL